MIGSVVKSAFRALGIEIGWQKKQRSNFELRDVLTLLSTIREVSEGEGQNETGQFLEFCAANFRHSKSQLFQDLFVLYELREKRGGFLVEFGATNGVELSNTYLLEKRYEWSGILAEPAAIWHDALRRNRDARLDIRCVWDKDNERLQFNEVADPLLSTIDSFSSSDLHAKTRVGGTVYSVDTVSFASLLIENAAPVIIDYLSIDTEGSEFKILEAFDFKKFSIKIITVEHNFTEDRARIHQLLTSNGFVRKFEVLSLWDDWYVAL